MVYRSTPGIGPIGARIFANEVEDGVEEPISWTPPSLDPVVPN